MEPCRIIRATGVPNLRLGDKITKGKYDNVTILSCYPDPCRYVLGTKIMIVKAREYSVKESGKHVIIVSRDGSEKYVYPKKVFDKVRETVEDIINGRVRRNGLLLAGAPGTGKTTLARVVAELYGLPYAVVSPGDIRRKYLGESEQRLREVFAEALEQEPAILIFDDAEWLLSSRTLGESREDEARIHAVLFSEFLRNFDRLVKEKRRVLVIATTNKKVSELDPAVRRGGRFGDAIIFPLPDVDTIELLFKVYGVVPDRKLIIKILNAGIEQSGIVNEIIESLKSGKKVEIKPRAGRGYKRMYLEPVEGVEKLFDYIPKDVFGKQSRFWIRYQFNIALPIVLSVFSAAGKSCVVISNLNYIEEAVPQANMYGSGLMFPTGISPVAELYVDNNAEYSVFFYGKKPPSVSAFPFLSLVALRRVIGVDTLLKIFINYLDIKLKEDEYKRVRSKFSALSSDEEIETFLNAVTTLRTLDDKILSLI